MGYEFLKKEDYEEPRCPFTKPTDKKTVPIRRIIEKLDEYFGRCDNESAEKHLLYWVHEARACDDTEGLLSLLNEEIGFFRKNAKESECFKAVEEALVLTSRLNLEKSVSGATTYLNAATAYKAFGKADEALRFYEMAQNVYEKELEKGDARLAGLYNNMALALADLGELDQARSYYERALAIMSEVENGEADMAITYCNLADLVALELGLAEGEKQIEEYLLTAEKLLDTESLPKDGYLAFVCDKCASVFGYYGYFLTERKLRKRACDIYERA